MSAWRRMPQRSWGMRRGAASGKQMLAKAELALGLRGPAGRGTPRPPAPRAGLAFAARRAAVRGF